MSDEEKTTPPAPKPSPEPPKPQEPKHQLDEESVPESSDPVKEKHASLVDHEGEGAPGDISGYETAMENPGAHPGDYSNVTGRTENA